jgi:hypothetical protein
VILFGAVGRSVRASGTSFNELVQAKLVYRARNGSPSEHSIFYLGHIDRARFDGPRWWVEELSGKTMTQPRGRPIDEQGTSNHVLSRDEAPIAAVIAHVAVVTHGEVAVRRNHNVIAL